MGLLAIAIVIGGFWLLLYLGQRRSARALRSERKAPDAPIVRSRSTMELTAPPHTRREAQWIPPGEAIEVCGHHLTEGLIYVGGSLKCINGYGVERGGAGA